MTAINSLIDVAGGMDSPLSGSMSVLEDAVLSVQTLCESFLAALENIPTQDFFRAEFRLPAEARGFNEEQEPAPQANVSVGIDVYAIAKQIQDAMGRIQQESISVPELCSDLAFSGNKMPVRDTSVSKEISRELTREYSHELYRETTKETAIEAREPRAILPPSLPEKSKPVSGSRWYRSRSRELSAAQPERPREPASVRTEPGEPVQQKTSLSYNIEQSIKRSTLVINEMENVIKNVVSADTIRDEAARPSSAIGQLESVRANPPRGINVRAAVETQEPTRNKDEPQDHTINSALVSNMAAATAPLSSMQKASADASENSRGLTDALARSVSAPSGMHLAEARENSANSEVQQRQVPPMVHVSKALSLIQNTYSVAGSQPAGIAREHVQTFNLAMPGARITSPAVNSAEYRVGLADVAIEVNRSIEVLSNVGAGPGIQSPIIRLINNVMTPAQSPMEAMTSPIIKLINNVTAQSTMDAMAGVKSMTMPVTVQKAQARDPVISLAVSMSAAHAAQVAGASAIEDFVLASPSIAGGTQSPAMADRNIVNVSMPGVTVEREMGGSVNKTSNFHNTFNINITMKGGGEEGDLKELGKKIGRILSDEIKRYGGA